MSQGKKSNPILNQNDFHGIIVKILRSFEYERALTTILLVLSVLIIIAIFYATNKNQSTTSLDASSNDLFERSKARGFEAVMQRLTAIMIFFWLLIAMILMVLSVDKIGSDNVFVSFYFVKQRHK